MPIPLHTFKFEGDDLFLLPQEPWKGLGVTPIKWLEQSFPRYLYTSDHIIKNADPYAFGDGPNMGGIYFLIAESEIVYAGQSNTICRRLLQHRKAQLPFSHYWCFGGIPQEFLEYVELFYIHTLELPLNNKYPPLCEPVRSLVNAHKKRQLQYANKHG